jgi:hypothetical protein
VCACSAEFGSPSASRLPPPLHAPYLPRATSIHFVESQRTSSCVFATPACTARPLRSIWLSGYLPPALPRSVSTRCYYNSIFDAPTHIPPRVCDPGLPCAPTVRDVPGAPWLPLAPACQIFPKCHLNSLDSVPTHILPRLCDPTWLYVPVPLDSLPRTSGLPLALLRLMIAKHYIHGRCEVLNHLCPQFCGLRTFCVRPSGGFGSSEALAPWVPIGSGTRTVSGTRPGITDVAKISTFRNAHLVPNFGLGTCWMVSTWIHDICDNYTGGMQRGLFRNKPALLVCGLLAAYTWLF